jgi:hypothetical protein
LPDARSALNSFQASKFREVREIAKPIFKARWEDEFFARDPAQAIHDLIEDIDFEIQLTADFTG